MSKIKILSLIFIFVLSLVVVPTSYAGAPPGTWVSGIACQNLGGAPAMITLTFYASGSAQSSLVYSDPTPIPVGGSRNYYTPNSPAGIPSGFLGSVTVASDQKLSCNINTQTTGSGTLSSPYRLATSAGFTENQIAPKMYAPQVMKRLGEPANSYSTYIAVQNTSQGSITVDVTYRDRFGTALPTAKESFAIPAQSNHIFYQDDNTNLPVGFLGAATISSQDGVSSLAVMVNFYNDGTSTSKSQFQSYSGFSDGASKLYIPRIVRNYYGYQGGLSIQNISTFPIDMVITFNFFGNTYTVPATGIQPGAALALYTPNIAQLNPVDSLPRTQRYGSAIIDVTTPNGKAVAIVNETNNGGKEIDGTPIPIERAGQGSTYNAIPDGFQTPNLFFAQVTANAGGVLSGGFQVANTTGTSGTCTIKYAGRDAAQENNVPLPANGSFARYAPNVANIAPPFNAAVSVTCTQPIVGIANMAANIGSGRLGDSATTGNGLNTP